MLGSKLDIFKIQWLDVVFADRNKAYGAYQLRKENSRTTSRALLIGCVLFVLAVSSPIIIKYLSGFIPESKEKLIETEVVLQPPPPVDENTPPPPPPPEPPRPKVSTIKFPPLAVVPEKEVVEEPPTVEEIKVADPGQKTIEGDPTAEAIIDAPVGEAPKGAAVTEDSNEIFTSVEVLPEPPGGATAWQKFMGTYKYPQAAIESGVSGRLVLSFVVEKDGSLTDIKVVRDPGPGLGVGQAGIDLLKKSKKWTPGVQNGRPVRVAYNQTIMLNLEGQ